MGSVGCGRCLGVGSSGGQGGAVPELEALKSGLGFVLKKKEVWINNPSPSSTKIRIVHSPSGRKGKCKMRLTEVAVPE